MKIPKNSFFFSFFICSLQRCLMLYIGDVARYTLQFLSFCLFFFSFCQKFIWISFLYMWQQWPLVTTLWWLSVVISTFPMSFKYNCSCPFFFFLSSLLAFSTILFFSRDIDHYGSIIFKFNFVVTQICWFGESYVFFFLFISLFLAYAWLC